MLFAALVPAIAFLPSFLSGADQPLLKAIRQGDMAAVQQLLKSGADLETRDEYGATALMYAAAFSSPDCVRLLLDAGADINATSNQGSTALMWSTADAVKVRLLLGHHADVNARTKDGGTALLSAAFRENLEVLRMLIAAGADPRAEMQVFPSGGPKFDIAKIAYSSNEHALRDFMSEAAIKPPRLAALVPFPGASVLGTVFMITAFSQRQFSGPSLAGTIQALLDLGANPNEDVPQFNRVLSPLARTALLGDLESMRVLLEHGADPNRRGSRGTTALMMAAATEFPDPAAVRLLLEHGATIDARDELGRGALDWALMQGETEVSRTLREKGATRMVNPLQSPSPVTTPRTAREALRIAISRLQPAGETFHEKTRCISCHHQSLLAIAVKLAAVRGVEVDAGLAKHPAKAALEMWSASRENFLMGNCSIFGFLGNITYGLLAMAEEGIPPNPITDAAASCLSSLQRADGRWEGGDMRPPLAGRSPMLYTAMAVRGLKAYLPAGRRDEVAARIERARAFLRTVAPGNNQEQSFKLLGLVWSGAPVEVISAEAKRLRSLQDKDGGWGQRSSMAADAYATGQALYALRTAGLSPASSDYRKGVKYLLGTQREDGTWYVRSRAVGFQPYFETGFPYGTDQFISAAATSWAAIALAYTL
jgi:ankyrin repeat protein